MTRDYEEVALAFAKALTNRDYDAAYALTAAEYRNGTTQAPRPRDIASPGPDAR